MKEGAVRASEAEAEAVAVAVAVAEADGRMAYRAPWLDERRPAAVVTAHLVYVDPGPTKISLR